MNAWVVVIFGNATVRSLFRYRAISNVLQISEERSGRYFASSSFEFGKADQTKILGKTDLSLIKVFNALYKLAVISSRLNRAFFLNSS